MPRIPSAAWLALGVRGALAALLLLYAALPDLPQFEGKAMLFRAGLYPLVAAALPAVWWWRGRPRPYPHLPDALLVLPLVIDTAGNSVDLFRYVEFGWAIHFASMALITTGLGMLLSSRPLGRGVTAMLVLGTGAVLHTLWELFEWVGVEAFGLELDVRYTTTMGDFATGLGGSALGALITARVSWPRPYLGGALVAPRIVPAPREEVSADRASEARPPARRRP